MNNTNELEWHTIFSYFLNNLSDVSEEDKKDLMKSACTILNEDFSDELKSEAITILYQIAFLDTISLEECWEIYWILFSEIFTNANLNLNGSLRLLYNHIYHFVEETLQLNYPYQKINTRNQSTIVMVVNQFLSPNHSATLRVLDYSYAIKKYLHKNIIIINTSELNYYKNQNLEPSYNFNFYPDYSNISSLSYKDESFEFYQVNTLMPNLDVYKALVQYIYEINPLFVYNIGESNILSDLCTNFTTTCSLPCSYKIPISCSKYLLVGRKIDENDKNILNDISENQHIIETEMNFNSSDTNITYSRKDFGLEEDSFLSCIVGNRLDTEIDDSFLGLIKKIIENCCINILFIGTIANEQRILNIIAEEKRNQIHFLGFQKHASSIIKFANLYINPKRSGGGRSSFEALSNGIPVVTLKYGDVYYACGKKFSANNYDEMYYCIKNYYNDLDFYKSMQQEALSRSYSLSNIENSQKTLINTILEKEIKEQ